MAARSNAVRASHAGKAAPAAAIARRASSRSPQATSPSDSPVAGLVASIVSPDAASTHAPSMNIRVLMAQPGQRLVDGRSPGDSDSPTCSCQAWVASTPVLWRWTNQ